MNLPPRHRTFIALGDDLALQDTGLLAAQLIRSRYPRLEEALTTGSTYPAGKGPGDLDQFALLPLLPKLENVTGRTLLVAVADPIERFRRVCARRNAVVDMVLARLEQNRPDPELVPQSEALDNAAATAASVQLYRVPDHLNELAEAAGLTAPAVPNPVAAPILTPEQEARVAALYATDIALHESITAAGMDYDPVPLADRKAAALRSLERAAAQRLSEGIEVGGITLAATPADQAAFANLLALLREAYDLQPDNPAKQAFLATPQVISDLDGTLRTLPGVRPLRQLLVSYGADLRDLWTENATARSGIMNATTRAELDAIRTAD
jgi:hypothetical protein